MNIPNADEIKTILSQKIVLMHKARLVYKGAQSDLLKAGVCLNYNNVHLSNSIENIFDGYFDNLSDLMTIEFSKGTAAKIKLDRSLFAIKKDLRIKLSGSEKLNASVQSEVLQEVLDSIDFKAIVENIQKCNASIYSEGLSIIADKLSDKLNLFFNPNYETSTFVKPRHIVCVTGGSDSYHSTKIGELENLNNALEYVSTETGFNFGDAIDQLKKELGEINYLVPVASRKVFCKGSALEIVCFKEKYEFRFTHNAFDALSAFITMYDTDKNIERLFEITSQMQSAA
jgi:hypothetical protein